jgi:hypothetical protein
MVPSLRPPSYVAASQPTATMLMARVAQKTD